MPSAPASGSKCALCHDTGIVIDEDAETARVCSCMKVKKTEKLLRSSNISEEFMGKSFEKFNWKNEDKRIKEAYQTAKKYSEGLVARIQDGQGIKGYPWLGLLGAPGSGKTHLAHAVTKPLFELGLSVLFFNWVSSFKEWMSWYNSDNKEKVEEIRQTVQNVDILILDDLCKESVNDNWVREIYGIVDYRYRKGLPVIYTSEYFSELIEYLSEATAGRLFEMSWRSSPPSLVKMLLKEKESPLVLDYRLKPFLQIN